MRLALAVLLVSSLTSTAGAAGLLDAPLPDDAHAPILAMLERLGEVDAADLSKDATGVVATDPGASQRSEGFGDAAASAGALAIVRFHSPRFCNDDRCLTIVGTMSLQNMSICAAFIAGADVETTGMVRDVLGATARGFAFPGPAGRTSVMVRPGLCLVIPPTGEAQGQATAPPAKPAAPQQKATDGADGTQQ